MDATPSPATEAIEAGAKRLMEEIRENNLINAVDLGVWLYSPFAEECIEGILVNVVNQVKADLSKRSG